MYSTDFPVTTNIIKVVMILTNKMPIQLSFIIPKEFIRLTPAGIKKKAKWFKKKFAEASIALISITLVSKRISN